MTAMAAFNIVLQALRPGADFSNPDNTLQSVRWDTPGVVPPTQQEFDLAVARFDKLAAIDAAAASALAAGVAWNQLTFQIDGTSQQHIAARALYARSCIDGHDTWDATAADWIAANNSMVPFTAADFWSFAKAAQAAVTTIVRNARVLKDTVAAAQAADAVSAIDTTQGWAATS
jgi:Domain of unknown function (DUF4376)